MNRNFKNLTMKNKLQVILASLTLFVLPNLFADTVYDAALWPTTAVSTSCASADVAGWFGGTITTGGAVSAADSLNFSSSPTNCNFHEWSWQMFLWLTSPNGSGEDLVLNSTPFFKYVDDDSNIDSGGTLTVSPTAVASNVRALGSDAAGDGDGFTFIWGGENNNLVYALVHTNDVMAYFGVMNNDETINLTSFPTTETEIATVSLAALENYEATFSDSNTLIMEIKTAWVVASSVPDKSDYILGNFDVPLYDTTNSSTWTANDPTTTEMALVGVHVVGTVNGHPEMIWATFEHIDNAPNAPFIYTGSDGTAQTYSNINADGTVLGDNWLLIDEGYDTSAMELPIAANNTFDFGDNSISVNASTTTLTGQPIYRQAPWGTQSSDIDATDITNATNIISLNQYVLDQISGDVRANYFLVGSIWTTGSIPNSTTDAANVGSLILANTTLETFGQDKSCFDCHNRPVDGTSNLAPLSRIYDKLSSDRFTYE